MAKFHINLAHTEREPKLIYLFKWKLCKIQWLHVVSTPNQVEPEALAKFHFKFLSGKANQGVDVGEKQSEIKSLVWNSSGTTDLNHCFLNVTSSGFKQIRSLLEKFSSIVSQFFCYPVLAFQRSFTLMWRLNCYFYLVGCTTKEQR